MSSGANTSSWIAQPNSGRIGRSPGAVPRMIRMLCSMRSWPALSAMWWVPCVTCTGYVQPAPMKSLTPRLRD